jgi:hypothetical protein
MSRRRVLSSRCLTLVKENGGQLALLKHACFYRKDGKLRAGTGTIFFHC